jgi:hypothetical protein
MGVMQKKGKDRMKRLITLGLIAALLAIGSPAQVSSAQEGEGAYPPSIIYTVVGLYAGRDTWVGLVRVWNSYNTLYVQTILNEGWLLNDIQACIATDPALIPQTKSGNPIPGHFLLKEAFSPGAFNHTFEVPVQWPIGTRLYIAVHASVSRYELDENGHPVGNVLQTEGAWAGDNSLQFEGGNWAIYFVDHVDKAWIPK